MSQPINLHGSRRVRVAGREVLFDWFPGQRRNSSQSCRSIQEKRIGGSAGINLAFSSSHIYRIIHKGLIQDE